MLSRHNVGSYNGNELARNSSGNVQPQSSQFAEPLWTDPGFKSGTGVRELISTKKKKKLSKLLCEEKRHHLRTVNCYSLILTSTVY